MPLIIRDELVNPPTWFASFRDLTLCCSIFLKLDVLIASSPEHRDSYYSWMKPRGGMDFISQIISPGEQDGINLDTEARCAPTIITDRISPENVHYLLGRIKAIKEMK